MDVDMGENESSSDKTLQFAMMLGKLKATKRTGWVRCGVHDPESVADHMYRMATLAFLVDKDAGLDKDRCIRLCLVHDMAECIVGDITPWDGISVEEKHQREHDAMAELTKMLSDDVGKEMMELWKEYEAAQTAEAKFVKDLDKFDMVLQAYEYEKQDKKPNSLQQFFDSTQGKFKTDQVQGWVDSLHKMRGSEADTSQTSSGNSSEGGVSCDQKSADHGDGTSGTQQETGPEGERSSKKLKTS